VHLLLGQLVSFFVCLLVSLPLSAQPLRISVSIPGPGAACYLPVELISKIGADKAEGVDLRVVFSPGGSISIAEMLTNNVDFAVVGLPAAMSARLKDPRVIALAAINDLPLYVLLVRQGLKGEVKSIADLQGRTVGIQSSSATGKTTSQQLSELIFRRGGLPLGSYRTVSIGRRWESESMMLRTGIVDAVMADEPQASVMIENKIAFPLLHFGDTETRRLYSGAGFLRATLIGRRDRLAQDPKKSALMVKIIQRTLHWIAIHSPEEVVDKLGVSRPEDRARLVSLLATYPRLFSKDGKFSLRQLRETEIFFIDSQAGNPAAADFRIESMIVSNWAGRAE
jgi:NitT/TauT family transport system substrate-binding protein